MVYYDTQYSWKANCCRRPANAECLREQKRGVHPYMFAIDRYSPTPIYEQLTAQFERLILLGLLAPNAALPSVRALSQELSVNPNTVQKAYADLERRGLCFTAPGTGRYITVNAAEILRSDCDELLTALRTLGEKLAAYGVPQAKANQALAEGYEAYQTKGERAV